MKKEQWLLLPVFLGGCLLSGSEEETRIAPAVSIERIRMEGRSVSFTVRCRIPTPCWKFHHYEESIVGTDYYAAFYVERTNASVCPQVVSHLDVSYTASVEAAGRWGFHFARTDTSFLDTTLQVGGGLPTEKILFPGEGRRRRFPAEERSFIF